MAGMLSRFLFLKKKTPAKKASVFKVLGGGL